jgi:hypothetical protein
MKKTLTFFLTLVIVSIQALTQISCASEVHELKTTVKSSAGKLELTVIEPNYEYQMSATIKVIGGYPMTTDAESAPIPYDYADIQIDGETIGSFTPDAEGLLALDFEMFTAGDLACQVQFYKGADIVGSFMDTVSYDIQTLFIRGYDTYRGMSFESPQGGSIFVFPVSFTAGSWDTIFLVGARIPAGATMDLTLTGAKMTDTNPKWGNIVGAYHFRDYDYRGRFALYEEPDQPAYHIDAETDKYIHAPIEGQGQGAHEYYVCPDFPHDRTLVTVGYTVRLKSGETYTGAFKAYSDSLVW